MVCNWIQQSFLIVLSILCLSAGSVDASEPSDSLNISLKRTLHFLTVDGSDVLLRPGAYQVMASEDWLKLIPEDGGRHDAILLEAKVSRHEEDVEFPEALTSPGDSEDVEYVALVLPNGRILEALGTSSGIRPRGLKFGRVSRYKTRKIIRRARSSARKGLTHTEKPSNSGGNSGPSCGKTESRYTTAPTCVCKGGEHKSTWTKKFKRKKLNFPEQCKMAANGAKYFCSTKGKVVGFQYKVLEKKSQKTPKGSYEGHCKIKYQCKWQKIKHSRHIKKWQPFPRIKNGEGGNMGSVKVIREEYRTKSPDHEALLKQACLNGKNKTIKELREKDYQKVRSFDQKFVRKELADWDTYYWLKCVFRYKYTYWPVARKDTDIFWCENQ